MGFITGYTKQQRQNIKKEKENYSYTKSSWVSKFESVGFSKERALEIFEKYTMHQHAPHYLCNSDCQPQESFVKIIEIETPKIIE